MSEGITLIKVAEAPKRPSIEDALEALRPGLSELVRIATESAGWPEEMVRRAILIHALGTILEADGVDAAIEAVSAELEALRETAS